MRARKANGINIGETPLFQLDLDWLVTTVSQRPGVTVTVTVTVTVAVDCRSDN